MAGLSENQQRLLECPVCYDRLKPPIETCVNGHGICTECRRNLTVCPVCKQNFTKDKNTLLNQLIETITVKCKYRVDGCNEEHSISNITDHERFCAYKPTGDFCFFCDSEYFLSDLNNHFHEHDQSKIKVNWCETFFLEVPAGIDSLSQIVYVENIQNHFLIRLLGDWREEVVLFCVQYIGKREDANKYLYNISINQGLMLATPCIFACNGICVPYFYATEEMTSARVIKLDLKSIFFDFNYLTSGFMIEVYLQRLQDWDINKMSSQIAVLDID